MKIEIKDATVRDAETISRIHSLSWKSAYQGIVPQPYLDQLKNDFWVSAFEDWIENRILKVKQIYENHLPVGCISYGNARDEKLANWGEIVSLYIHPSYVRKGYGRKLLEIALQDMKSDDIQNCYLWVLKENSNARHFYEKNGFQCTEDSYNVKIMEKQLNDIRYIIDLKNQQ